MRGCKLVVVVVATAILSSCLDSPPGASEVDGGCDGVEAAACGDAYRDAVLADEPIAYWRLGEPDGIRAFDERGDFHGWYEGDPVQGVPGLLADSGDTAARLDGVDGRILTPVTLASVFSVEAVIAATVSTTAGIFAADEYEVSGFRMGLTASGTFEFWTDESGGSGRIATPSSVDDGAPHHVAATFDGECVVLYVDGGEAASGPLTFVPSGQVVVVGATTQSNYLPGIIDEPAVYDRVLPAERVREHSQIALGF